MRYIFYGVGVILLANAFYNVSGFEMKINLASFSVGVPYSQKV